MFAFYGAFGCIAWYFGAMVVFEFLFVTLLHGMMIDGIAFLRDTT